MTGEGSDRPADGDDLRLDDPELGRLDPSSYVEELLTRMERALAVDTIAVLMLDRGGTHLVARLARGLEEEVHQSVQVPVGSGFAGSVATSRHPVALTDVGPETVGNPILWERGVRSMLGVPLLVGDRLVGVLHVGSLHDRSFDGPEIATVQAGADRVAAALSAHQTVADRSAARILQESLLPTELPQVEGLEFASRFVAAEDFGVGGDWFDVFRLPDGQVGMVIGDVAGSGLRAAVVMGRLRSALRAYAIESSRPSEALARLERKFAHFEPDEMATVLYLTIANDLSHFTLSSLGHPPPVVATPGSDAYLLDCRPSPPIGAHARMPRVDIECPLLPGTTVGGYTDGLVERRGESIDEGLERLRRAFSPGAPEAVCRAVMGELVGSGSVEDDTALVVFRRSP